MSGKTRSTQRYSALIIDVLTPVYDLFVRIFFPEKRFKQELITHARIAPSHHVLDIGAGTGTLAIMIKQIQPGVQVTGMDSDVKILSIARNKASRAGVEIKFSIGDAVELPYKNEAFDRILSSLVMSLLSRENKLITLCEIYRVLRKGGELFIADFGPPHTRWGQLLEPLLRRFERISDNLEGILPTLFQQAGFEDIAEVSRYSTVFGTLMILRGCKHS